jgi:hypothetical protein
MKWRKLGQLFDPAEHRLPFANAKFAQAPQALVLPDRVRIYFSTRVTDASGKYLSQVAFADFERGMQRLLGVSQRPVIAPGGLGCFDEHGIFPFNVLHDGDSVRAYTTGLNRRASVSVDAAIGLAISHDQGLSFARHGSGPVMAAALHEPFLVGDAFVARYGATWHMWYIFGTRWLESGAADAPERVYKIAHARSHDGIAWQRDARAIVADRLDADECQALPTVIELDGVYHLYFCYRAAHGFRSGGSGAYRLGYAWSRDLVHWTRDDSRAGIDVSDSGWDAQMQCYPHLFSCDGEIYLLYNGNEFGRHGFGLAILER